MIYSGTALLAIGNGIMWPSLLAILSRTTERNVQGAVQGFASSTGAVASIAGLLLGGALYDSLGNRVFLVPAILVALTCGLAFFLPAKGKAKDE
jgi:MFS family permease